MILVILKISIDKLRQQRYNEHMNKCSYVERMSNMNILKNATSVETCDSFHTHEETVDKIKANMPPDEELYDLAELYKIFGDSTRVKILCILLTDEICVCDIAALVGVSQSAISHQLRLLKQANLIKPRRDGKTVYYSLADSHVKTIINNGLEHIAEK